MDIYVVPLKFSNFSLLNDIVNKLSTELDTNIYIYQLEIDSDIAFSQDRRQYYSTQLIAEAIPKTLSLNGKVLLLTEFDLYIPVFTYVFGEAQLNGKHCIVSICRLHEEFYSGKTDNNLLLIRALKEILHEIGHNFGLVHCKDWDCVMHVSMGIEEIDIKGDKFCKICNDKFRLKRP